MDDLKERVLKTLNRVRNAWFLSSSSQLPESLLAPAHVDLSDVVNSLLLAEACYKAVDHGPQAALNALNGASLDFPHHLVTLQKVAFSHKLVQQMYMIGQSQKTLYISIVGTKQFRDIITDLTILETALWEDNNTNTAGVHRGFFGRSGSIPIEALYQYAQHLGLNLVLCGHSLGGAVASLCCLKLLERYNPTATALKCISFGMPALGNRALVEAIGEKNWHAHFLNYSLPEDPIPRVFVNDIQPEGKGEVEVAARLLHRARAYVLPSYSHFGQFYYVSKNGGVSTSLPADEYLGVGRFTGIHTMKAYRHRFASLLRKSLSKAGKTMSKRIDIVEDMSIAPISGADRAEGTLPVVYDVDEKRKQYRITVVVTQGQWLDLCTRVKLELTSNNTANTKNATMVQDTIAKSRSVLRAEFIVSATLLLNLQYPFKPRLFSTRILAKALLPVILCFLSHGSWVALKTP